MKIKNDRKILRKFILSCNFLVVIKILTLLLIMNNSIQYTSAKIINDDSINKTNENENSSTDNNLNLISEITSSSIHKFFDNSEIMLILFTEPNCLKCNRFIKIFMELNEKLSKENTELKKIKLATVNGFQEKQIVEKNNIEEIPSFLFKNKKQNYEEIITDIQGMNDLYEFLHKKIIRNWILLENLQQVNDFREKRINMIVCRNEKSEIHNDFFKKLNSIITKYEDVNYYLLNVMKYKSDIQKLEKEYKGN